MKAVPLLALTLVVVVSAGCSQRAKQESLQPLPEASQTIVEYWPGGGLRLRKQVLRLDDGTLVDHGPFERWYKNGQKEYEAVFVHGKKEGTTVRYHENGQPAMRQEYKDGKRSGRSITWDATGAKVKEENWAGGQPHGTWTVWQDGKVKWTHTYEHGVPAPVPPSDKKN